MLAHRINETKKKEFKPVTIEVTFETLEELKEIRQELNNSSFKFFDLIVDAIEEYDDE